MSLGIFKNATLEYKILLLTNFTDLTPNCPEQSVCETDNVFVSTDLYDT